jgi:hypothetical protein
MERAGFEAIIESLEREGVRYLVAGGLAVVAHGYVRLTVDVDIILDLEPENVLRAVRAMKGLGYRPRVPVAFESLADEEQRRGWIEDKGMRVFSIYDPDQPLTEVDLFVQPPFDDFDDARSRAVRLEVRPGLEATFVGLDDLLRLKREAGRPKDLMDIENLERIRRGGDDDEG